MRATVSATTAVIAAVASGWPSAARASELSDLTLTWEAPPGCPDRDALLARVAELVGQRGGEQSHAPLAVHASLTPLADASFRAELRSTQAGSERTRTLEAQSCSELTEASAVVIALALSPPGDDAPDAAVGPTVVTGANAAPLEPPRPAKGSAPADDAVQQPVPLHRSSVRLGADAGLALDFGTLSPASPGLAFGLSGRYGRYLEHALRVSLFPSQRTAVDGHPDQGVAISLAAAALALCVQPFTGALELGACGELELGMLHVDGFGTTEHYAHDSPWVAPGVGLRVAYPGRGRLRLALTGDALFPTERTEFVVTNSGVARKLPAVAGRMGIFAELIFL